VETLVKSILMPTPDRPRPELLASLPALHERLEEQRQFRIEQLAMLGDPVDSRDVTPAAVHPVDEHRQIATALVDGARRALADIETALYRMRTGRYGMCLRCGAPIPLERLRLIPQLGQCGDCQR
jgi:RNA polymerase-binding transcription factor DksA